MVYVPYVWTFICLDRLGLHLPVIFDHFLKRQKGTQNTVFGGSYKMWTMDPHHVYVYITPLGMHNFPPRTDIPTENFYRNLIIGFFARRSAILKMRLSKGLPISMYLYFPHIGIHIYVMEACHQSWRTR